MQAFLQIGVWNAVMALALALVAAGIGLFSPRPAVRHTLWLLVLLKLITPPVISIPVACPAALEGVVRAGKVACSWPWADEHGDLKQAAAHGNKSSADDDFIPDDPERSPATATVPPAIAASAPNDVERTLMPASFLTVVFAIWLSGTALWFAVAAMRIYRFQQLLRHGKAGPPPLQDETSLLAERLGLTHCPTVWLVPGRVSPLLWALGSKVCLVLPVDLLSSLRPEQRASLLAHELAHALRRDHWVRWLEFVVTGLYWWLPVAWWARRQLQQAEEECCDAWVVWTLPAAAKAYAKALLQTVDFLDARPALPPVASGIGHVHFLKRRLTMIVRQPLCPSLPWPAHLAVVVLGLLFLPLAPQRLAAQVSEDQPAATPSSDAQLVRLEQDSESRDTERRLRALEEKLDRLMKKLDAPRDEKPDGKPSGADRAEERAKAVKEKARAMEEKARAKEKEMAEKARARSAAERGKEATWRFDFDGKSMTPEQIEKLKKDIQEKVGKAVDPERMKQIQKRITETVDKNLSPERMEEIQRKVNDALKKSNQEINEALKKSAEQLERAKKNLADATKPSAPEARPEKGREPEQRNLERRMDRLEQKMDRVIQALEKQGKSAN